MLRRLGYKSQGGNAATVKKYAALWRISTAHFDPDAVRNEALQRARGARRPIDEILVEGSTFSRHHLKERLFAEGLKQRECETCGQGEIWRGRRMALILDHINGIPDDHRLENLRILCPNCAATLDTHCSRKNRLARLPRECRYCGDVFVPKYDRHRYCSRACGQKWDRSRLRGVPRPSRRLVERPPLHVLLAEVARDGYLATGRKYGVSDNAIRKWVRCYENEMARRRREGADELDQAA